MTTVVLIGTLLVSLGVLWWMVRDMEGDADLDRVLTELEVKRQEEKHGR